VWLIKNTFTLWRILSASQLKNEQCEEASIRRQDDIRALPDGTLETDIIRQDDIRVFPDGYWPLPRCSILRIFNGEEGSRILQIFEFIFELSGFDFRFDSDAVIRQRRNVTSECL
jgi:hypothetical protein